MEGRINHEVQTQNPEQRIYVASLSDYNHGRLRGCWIDASQSADEIQADINQMLSGSPLPGAEEWAIHDYEGFGPLRLGEYESLELISCLAEGVAEHGPAFAFWVEHVGTDDLDLVRSFEDHYLGSWNSLSDYAEHIVEELGTDLGEAIPNWIRPYVQVNYESLGRDLACDLYESEGQGCVYLFQVD